MPASMKRSCQRQTHVLDLPVAAMIPFVPTPSAVRSTIPARQTCFCGALRSCTTALSRRISADETERDFPARIAQNSSDVEPASGIPSRTQMLGSIHFALINRASALDREHKRLICYFLLSAAIARQPISRRKKPSGHSIRSIAAYARSRASETSLPSAVIVKLGPRPRR